jgi:hypothetical protein
VERMSEERSANNVVKNKSEGKTSVGKQRKWWLDAVENDLEKMGVRDLRKILKDRDAWKCILKKARILHGLYSQWKYLCKLRQFTCPVTFTVKVMVFLHAATKLNACDIQRGRALTRQYTKHFSFSHPTEMQHSWWRRPVDETSVSLVYGHKRRIGR